MKNHDVNVGGSRCNLIVPAAKLGQTATFCVDNIQYQVAVPTLLPKVQDFNDELLNTSLGFLRLMNVFLVFNDIIHAGNITRFTSHPQAIMPYVHQSDIVHVTGPTCYVTEEHIMVKRVGFIVSQIQWS
jgi:hypothetical protein